MQGRPSRSTRGEVALLGSARFAAKEREAQQRRVAQFDALAEERERWIEKNRYYYDSIVAQVRFVVPEGASVLEIGCGTGHLLAALRPSHGVGVDLSPRLIDVARRQHPQLEFYVADAQELDLKQLGGRAFDYVVLADTVGYVGDVWALFRALRGVCHARTRVFISYYNFVWEPILRLGTRLGLRMPVEQGNWLGVADVANLLELNHFEVVKHGTATLVPKEIPVVSRLLNRYVAHLPGVRHLALTQYFVARVRGGGGPIPERDYSCSVVVPCKNERGNVTDIVDRTPSMGRGTELIFVDGNSDDGTREEIQREMAAGRRSDLTLRLIDQGDGRGKGDAVRKGFEEATGDMLFILDADLTVPPEDLPKFYAAIAEGCGEFVNGSRLVYPMEGEAMRLLNLLGNRFFGWSLSTILGQRLKDTLCGTKVLLRRDYEAVKATRRWLGEFDPFGDFDLIFGAAKANLKIVELPVRYRARTYGETKIRRFAHGFLLFRMTAHALRKFRLALA